jgi:hypothetical protein
MHKKRNHGRLLCRDPWGNSPSISATPVLLGFPSRYFTYKIPKKVNLVIGNDLNPKVGPDFLKLGQIFPELRLLTKV